MNAQERFYDPLFAVGVKYNVKYGVNSNPDKKQPPLLMDVYFPLGDTMKNRPLIILEHGGGFIMGNKNNYPMETLCSRFAQFGYVCASINYSLGFDKKGSVDDITGKTVLNSVQDMKAAIRYFRANTDQDNHFQIDPNQIWVGGSSSGAITALHTAFWKEKDFSVFSWKLEENGGIEGNGGNLGYSSKVQGVISLSGAIGDTSFINESIPVVSVHGEYDPIVPYNTDKINFNYPIIGKVPPVQVMGSSVLHQALDNRGIPNALLSMENQGHCPFDKMLDWKRYPVYMDMTINHIRNFMYNQLWNDGTEKTDMTTRHTSTITYERDSTGWYFYPVDKNVKKIKLYLFDENGNRIRKDKVKKKRKSFYWKGKKLPEKLELRAVYNLYRTDWFFGMD